MISAVIFDLDGTLLNTLDDLADSMNFVLKNNGFPERTLKEIRSFVGNGLCKLAERSLPENTSAETVNKITLQLKEYYGGHCNIKTCPYDGAVDCMKKLRQSGIKTAVLTNKHEPAALALCSRFFDGCSDYTAGDDGIHMLKPAPDGVFRICSYFDVDKSEVLYVGDSEVDAQTAQNAGVKGVGVTWGFRSKIFLETCGFDYIAENFAQIANIIKKNC